MSVNNLEGEEETRFKGSETRGILTFNTEATGYANTEVPIGRMSCEERGQQIEGLHLVGIMKAEDAKMRVLLVGRRVRCQSEIGFYLTCIGDLVKAYANKRDVINI